MTLIKHQSYLNKKITKSARGEPCTMLFPEICTGGGDDTVYAHSNYLEDGKGVGCKSDDLFGAYMCHVCHDEYDGRTRYLPELGRDDLRDWFHRAMKRTWRRLIDKEVLK